MSEELKNLLRNAKSAEEAKHIVDTDRQALEDKDLSNIAGGNELDDERRALTWGSYCPEPVDDDDRKDDKGRKNDKSNNPTNIPIC